MMRAMWHCSQLIRRLAHVALGLCLILAMAVTACAWRLALGPVNVSWLTAQARAALLDEADPVRVSFGSASLAWGDPDEGLEHIVELRLTDPVADDARGHVVARAPLARMTFSVPALLTGRFVPRSVEVDDADVTLPDGVLASPLSALPGGVPGALRPAELRAALRRIAAGINGGSGGFAEQLRRLRLRNARVVLSPRAPRELSPGAAASLPPGGPAMAHAGPLVVSRLDLEMTRRPAGRLRASASAEFRLGGEGGAARLGVDLLRDGNSRLRFSVSPMRPAALTFLPQAAALDVPVGVAGSVTVDARFLPRAGEATLTLGAGGVHAGEGVIPIRSGRIDLTGTGDTLRVTAGRLDVTPVAGMPPALLGVQGTARFGRRITATANLTLDHVDLAQLPMIWPPGLGGGARPWIVKHVLGGRETHGSATFTVESDADFRNPTVTGASGDMDGDDVAFTWLDDMPAIRQASVRLHLAGPDTLDIAIPAARQSVRDGRPDLLVQGGLVRITGLTGKDQYADIRVQTAGPLGSALALLKEPRLHLLSAHPLGVAVDGGSTAASLGFQFRMDERLTMDGVAVKARARLGGVRLPAVAGTSGLENGAFDLSVTRDGLQMTGQGMLAATPVTLRGAMDFTAGPPTQVVQRVVVTGRPSVGALRDGGVDVSGWAAGTMPVTITVLDRRAGPETVSIDGDLTDAALAFPPLAWRKPPGEPARLAAVLSVQKGRLLGVRRFSLSGHGLAVSGSARVAAGRVSAVTLADLQLGRTRGRGTVRLVPGQPVTVALTASMLDLGARLAEKTPGRQAADAAPLARTPSWTLEARVEQVLLANDVTGRDLVLKGRGDGEIVHALDAAAWVQGGGRFALSVLPQGGRRHLRIDAQDAGTLLRGLDVVRTFRSGRLAIDGWFERPDRYGPLAGSVTIEDVELTRSPAVARLLQAVTIYGLADLMRGGGMRFTKIDIPFLYDGGILTVRNARAFNASLGLTGEGQIGMRGDVIDANGTVVPAYFFNSMLGGLPLVGRLFSPEKGGGVFAVRFGVSGDLDDPKVTVNPVSALAPGILRNLFGVPAPDRVPRQPDGMIAAGR